MFRSAQRELRRAGTNVPARRTDHARSPAELLTLLGAALREIEAMREELARGDAPFAAAYASVLDHLRRRALDLMR